MSKIQDYDFPGLPSELTDMKDDLRDLVNNGKYQVTVTTTNPPNWAANAGEMAVTLAGGSARFYVAYTQGTWIQLAAALT